MKEEITINVKLLIDNKITANQYLIAYLIKQKEFGLLETYVTSNGINQVDLDTLVNAKIIHNANDIGHFDWSKISIRESFSEQLFGDPDTFFDEFLEAYPTSVLRPDGHRDYLRKDLKRSRAKYKTLVRRSRTKHLHILEMLKHEVQYRTIENSLKYMKTLPKWLNSEEWKVTEQRKDDYEKTVSIRKEVGYGEAVE